MTTMEQMDTFSVEQIMSVFAALPRDTPRNVKLSLCKAWYGNSSYYDYNTKWSSTRFHKIQELERQKAYDVLAHLPLTKKVLDDLNSEKCLGIVVVRKIIYERIRDSAISDLSKFQGVLAYVAMEAVIQEDENTLKKLYPFIDPDDRSDEWTDNFYDLEEKALAERGVKLRLLCEYVPQSRYALDDSVTEMIKYGEETQTLDEILKSIPE